jgi:hypothetical protein
LKIGSTVILTRSPSSVALGSTRSEVCTTRRAVLRGALQRARERKPQVVLHQLEDVHRRASAGKREIA